MDVQPENPPEIRTKMYCVFAKESIDKMGGIRGKLGTQAGHAYLHAYWDALDKYPEEAKLYRDSQMAFKITLVVPTVEDLEKLHTHYRNVCGVSLVIDAGRTVFKNEDGTPCPTTTCLGIGPLKDSDKDEFLAGLRPLT